MIQSKEEFIRSFLPDEVENIELTQINMDITDLGLADILRNLNKLYPYNTRSRNAIISGKTVVGVLCRTETLAPLSGLFILICADQIIDKFEMMATNYLVLCLSPRMGRRAYVDCALRRTSRLRLLGSGCGLQLLERRLFIQR